MSGKRCKALRREFRERTGCAPEGAVTDIVMRKSSWLRRIAGVFKRETIEVPTLGVLTTSEWRQIKKAYQARRAA